VDTGDLLLFESKTITSKMQRLFTRSSIDHVALLLKYSNGKVVIFESLSNQGVGVVDWERFMRLNWHEMYNRVVYRKVYFGRTAQTLKTLEEFVKQSLGKGFQINPAKLLRKRNDEEAQGGVGSERTFFCSELVATAFKRMGLLPSEKAASQYWPGCFTSEGGAEFNEGVRLGEELLIDFSL